MKHLKSYKLFESKSMISPNDNDITFVRNILLDMSDDDISIKVSDLKEYSPNSPVKKISILIGDDEDELSEIFFDISKYIETLESINNYLTGEGYSLEFSHFLYFDENGMVTNSFHSSNFDEIKDKLKNITQLKICEIIYKDIEFVNDYIKECKWNIQNSLANCAFFAKDFYQWCQKKGIDCKLAYCEQSAPINSQCEPEDHIIPMIGRYLIDFVYTDKGVSHIVRENNKSESLKRQGDTVLGGRFKNKKIVVKKIGKNKKGDITINDKPLLKFRIVKESLQEDVDYYLRHLEDDNFIIQVSDDYFRIFKPINGTVYSYSNCNPFQWSEIAGEIDRYASELEGKSIDYAYVVEKVGMVAARTTRTQIPSNSLLDQTFDCGEILSFTIGFK